VPVAKPSGPTSHDVVDAVRRALDVRRVGHLGTLDPDAAGLLVVVVGRATRLARFAAGWTKTYEGAMRLGVVTTTDDRVGRVSAESAGWTTIREGEVAAAFATFRGVYDQRPPDYSAVKVDGERAYRRARRGEAVALAPRPVEVRELELTGFDPPIVRFRAVVGAGTYLRSLARDVGEALGCGAHLAELCRTAVGPFRLRDAVAPGDVRPVDLRDAAVLVADLPRRELTPDEETAVAHGRMVPGQGTAPGVWVALFAGGRLVGVAEPEEDGLRPRVVLAEA